MSFIEALYLALTLATIILATTVVVLVMSMAGQWFIVGWIAFLIAVVTSIFAVVRYK